MSSQGKATRPSPATRTSRPRRRCAASIAGQGREGGRPVLSAGLIPHSDKAAKRGLSRRSLARDLWRGAPPLARLRWPSAGGGPEFRGADLDFSKVCGAISGLAGGRAGATAEPPASPGDKAGRYSIVTPARAARQPGWRSRGDMPRVPRRQGRSPGCPLFERMTVIERLGSQAAPAGAPLWVKIVAVPRTHAPCASRHAFGMLFSSQLPPKVTHMLLMLYSS